MLTSVLRDSLGGNCMTSMVATVSTDRVNVMVRFSVLLLPCKGIMKRSGWEWQQFFQLFGYSSLIADVWLVDKETKTSEDSWHLATLVCKYQNYFRKKHWYQFILKSHFSSQGLLLQNWELHCNFASKVSSSRTSCLVKSLIESHAFDFAISTAVYALLVFRHFTCNPAYRVTKKWHTAVFE